MLWAIPRSPCLTLWLVNQTVLNVITYRTDWQIGQNTKLTEGVLVSVVHEYLIKPLYTDSKSVSIN